MRKSYSKIILILKKIFTPIIHLEASISVFRYLLQSDILQMFVILSTEKHLYDMNFLKTKLILCAGVVALCISFVINGATITW